MSEKIIKKWTILIYADGSNELAPEIWQSKVDAEKVGSSDNVNVVLQIAKEATELVKIIRPFYSLPRFCENWTGVRRYYILKNKSKMLQDLGNMCIADPHNLYDFIKWGVETYPSEHYMVILSGHGGGFVASMPDFSQDKPYMMGIYEMCRAINLAIENTKVQIDTLVFDMCNMNHLEIMYELGKNCYSPIKTILTYIRTGPISGLPYNLLINFIDQNSGESDMNILSRNLVTFLNLNLIAFEINTARLRKIKELISKMAYLYISKNSFKKEGGFKLLHKIDDKAPWYRYTLELHNEIKSMIIYYKDNFQKKDNIVDILDITTRELCNPDTVDKYFPIYCKLAFAKNNYWLYLLFNKSLEESLEFQLETTDLNPLTISRSELMLILRASNPHLNKDMIELIFKNLCVYKKWYNLIN